MGVQAAPQGSRVPLRGATPQGRSRQTPSLQEHAATTPQVAWMLRSRPQQCSLRRHVAAPVPATHQLQCSALTTLPQLFLASCVSSSSQNLHSTGARSEGWKLHSGLWSRPRLGPALCSPSALLVTHYPGLSHTRAVLQNEHTF